MKKIKFAVLVLSSIMAFSVIFVFERNAWPVGSSIAGVCLGFLGPAAWSAFQDLADTEDWKEVQRKLERGKIIDKDTIVRISFAYLFRIKIEDKYFLIKNERNTNKFQPVGGVYKLKESEKIALKNLFHIIFIQKIMFLLFTTCL